ncbi:hypothetical protein ETB97_005715 [Aspergillus alliaceus]|uniref:3-beta hydroxysteroid dehydrogenase/isomerase domain-containing protein n=1 Tax=Petromyces alliaceus TaxID=209559 RepID=A0A8H5ZWA1_PETAA|nr:hypothetical protein ETB97_005715 [Aspergillus burnettii]
MSAPWAGWLPLRDGVACGSRWGMARNPYDFMYVGNLADAYLLAAHALLNAWGRPQPTDPSVWADGEVFNISNDDPWLFWDFQSAVLALTRNPIRPEDIVVIPKWVGLVIGFLGEWVVWAISGRTRTADMTREDIRFSTLIRTLDISKAKRVLGYCPAVGVGAKIPNRNVYSLRKD